jgi:hypothetical protein
LSIAKAKRREGSPFSLMARALLIWQSEEHKTELETNGKREKSNKSKGRK